MSKETMSKETSSTRQQILDIAGELFFRYGFQTTGVDTIVRESGVAKMTLYRYFPSKDDLIVAYLEEANRSFWEWFDGAVQPHRDRPRQALLEVFRALEKLVESPTCYGCPFLIAAVEFPEPDSPGHRVSLEHKRAVLERFYELARQAAARDPGLLAGQLLLLMDGAFMAARMFGQGNPGGKAALAAQALMEAQEALVD
jgi:AcrR family transcriptional regulator